MNKVGNKNKDNKQKIKKQKSLINIDNYLLVI